MSDDRKQRAKTPILLKGEHMQNVFKELWFQVMVAMVPGVVTGILLSPSGA